MGTNFTLSLALLDYGLQTIKPRLKSLPSLGAHFRIAIVGLNRGVQKRAPASNQADPPFAKVPQDLTQTVNRMRNVVDSFETRIHCEFPSVIKGFSSQFLLAVEMTVDSAFFEAGCLHEIGEGIALIALLVEKWR
jgi:hypothetical protein